MSSAQLYDTIGATYIATRRTEPRIAARIWAALGDARTVLNVGAGTGSYEPPGRDVTAVEPSALMRAERPAGAAPCVAAIAESLPFEDQSFDAAMAFSTVHHWQDPIAGLRELQRVARRVVVFTHDSSDMRCRALTSAPGTPCQGGGRGFESRRPLQRNCRSDATTTHPGPMPNPPRAATVSCRAPSALAISLSARSRRPA